MTDFQIILGALIGGLATGGLIRAVKIALPRKAR